MDTTLDNATAVSANSKNTLISAKEHCSGDSKDSKSQKRKSTISSNDDEVSEITRGETLDLIDEAWEEGNPEELCLQHISLDRSTIRLLMQKWNQAQQARGGSPGSLKSIERVELHDCSFSNEAAADLFIKFLQKLGEPLKEIFVVDTFIHTDDFMVDERAVSLLRGLHTITSLERLAIDHADLSGGSVGLLLQNLLTHSANLNELRFNDCTIDHVMLDLFLGGLRVHAGLVRLDFDGLYLEDKHLKVLVDTLVNSPSRDTLQCLDLSRSDVTKKSFGPLARLLRKMAALDELVLNDCKYLGVDCTADDPAFRRFIAALSRGKTQLKELRMDQCQLGVDLETAITSAATKLQALTLGQKAQDENFIPSIVSKLSTSFLGPTFIWNCPKGLTRVDVTITSLNEADTAWKAKSSNTCRTGSGLISWNQTFDPWYRWPQESTNFFFNGRA